MANKVLCLLKKKLESLKVVIIVIIPPQKKQAYMAYKSRLNTIAYKHID